MEINFQKLVSEEKVKCFFFLSFDLVSLFHKYKTIISEIVLIF